jgi:hypothetical protein
LWAVAAGGRVGNVWVSDSAMAALPQALRENMAPASNVDCGFTVVSLRDGTTTLHVRDNECRPVVDARVTVIAGSIDDIAIDAPPPVQRLLTVHTNHNGVAFFCGMLGDTSLGFEVKAPGCEPRQDRSFSSLSNDTPKVFVINGDSAKRLECQEVIRKEVDAS